MENKKTHKILIFVSRIPEDIEIGAVFPKERNEEIEKYKNPRVKREKYFAWELLRRGAEKYAGVSLKELGIEKNGNGRWVSDRLFFSISHSGDLAAVAVSDTSVGIDVEAVRRHSEGIEARIMTDSELSELYRMPETEREEQIIKVWTQKESIFKTLDLPRFLPQKIEVKDYSVKTEIIVSGGQKYALSVSSENLENIEIEYFYEL